MSSPFYWLPQNEPNVAPFTGRDPCNVSDWCCYGSGTGAACKSVAPDPETWKDSNGETIKKYVDIGAGTQLYSNTIGALWSAATGTVSTDAKNILIHDQMIAQMQASNYGMTWAAVWAQAKGDVSTVLIQAKADPSQASVGNNPGLDNLKKWLEITAGLVAIYLLVELYLDYKGGNK